MYNWPLSDSNFTLLDRLKICKFFLDPKRQWTAGEEIRKYQKSWIDITKSQYVVMTSSGSTANTLIAQYVKDHTKKRLVIVPTLGWMTTYSPWIREGFELLFIDVSKKDLSMDLNKLEKVLKSRATEVACIFVVSILGFTPDMERLQEISKKYNVEIKMDNCESSNSKWREQNINTFFTSSTSLYFSHIHSTGTEGGLIFTNNKQEFIYYLLAANHGMVRGLEPYYIKNKENLGANELDAYDIFSKYNQELSDSRFDFYQLGNNLRSTDICAFIGGLDLARMDEYNNKRLRLYSTYIWNIDETKYHTITSGWDGNERFIPFAIPIIIKSKKSEKARRFKQAIEVCKKLGIEHRLLVSGNVLRQTAFKQYGKAKDFKVAEDLHNYAFYVGLNPKVKNSQVLQLVNELNNL